MRSWRPRVTEDSFSHRNKGDFWDLGFALFKTLRIKWDFIDIFAYILSIRPINLNIREHDIEKTLFIFNFSFGLVQMCHLVLFLFWFNQFWENHQMVVKLTTFIISSYTLRTPGEAEQSLSSSCFAWIGQWSNLISGFSHFRHAEFHVISHQWRFILETLTHSFHCNPTSRRYSSVTRNM
jgi:hypothetical protein